MASNSDSTKPSGISLDQSVSRAAVFSRRDVASYVSTHDVLLLRGEVAYLQRPAGCGVDLRSPVIEAGDRVLLGAEEKARAHGLDRKSTRMNSSHTVISYAVFCL